MSREQSIQQLLQMGAHKENIPVILKAFELPEEEIADRVKESLETIELEGLLQALKGVLQGPWRLDAEYAIEEMLVSTTWLGGELVLKPSGKIYAFWTTNQTPEDEADDAVFLELFERRADALNLFCHSFSGDFYVGASVDVDTLLDMAREVLGRIEAGHVEAEDPVMLRKLLAFEEGDEDFDTFLTPDMQDTVDALCVRVFYDQFKELYMHAPHAQEGEQDVPRS